MNIMIPFLIYIKCVVSFCGVSGVFSIFKLDI